MKVPAFYLTAIVALPALIFAQSDPVVAEAENASLGSSFESGSLDSVNYITIDATAAGNNPVSDSRVAEFAIQFPEAGEYFLYARVYVGAGGADDDSFHHANEFGDRDSSSDADWITINQISGAAGYSNPNDTVTSTGAVGSQIWKWLKLINASYTVAQGALSKTFQIGGREDGLLIDKIAFGAVDTVYTVAELDAGEGGSLAVGGGGSQPTGLPIATGKSKFLGSAHSGSQANQFEEYFNQVVPENAGKWGSVEGTRDVMNWGQLDAAYDLAKDNGFPFRFHVLVWGSQQPAWINALSPADQLEEIEEWFMAVADRYPDIDYLEVANEIINARPFGGSFADYGDALGGAGSTGYDWIITAFEMAREIFPAKTKLMINEYNIVNGGRLTEYLQIVDLLLDRDLLDVVSFQGHSFNIESLSSTRIISTLNQFASRDLPVIITELDIDGYDASANEQDDGGAVSAASDEQQLTRYQRVFPALWEHPSVIGVTLWGWRPGLWRQVHDAHLVRTDGSERPALVWLRDYIASSEAYSFSDYLLELELDAEIHLFGSDVDGDGRVAGLEYLEGTDAGVLDYSTETWLVEDLRGLLEIQSIAKNSEGYLELQRSQTLADWETIAYFDFADKSSNTLSVRIDSEVGIFTIDQPLVVGEVTFSYRLKYTQASPE